jgi:uncharacterized membrane protein YqaE (UPF0057 family)
MEMCYLIALLLPFVAFWMMGKVFSGIICLILQITLIRWLPAAIWAMITVSNYNADKRTDRIVRAIAETKR